MPRRTPVPKIVIEEFHESGKPTRVPPKIPPVYKSSWAKHHAIKFMESMRDKFGFQFFVVLTFRKKVTRRQAERLLTKWIHQVDRLVWGRRHYRRGQGVKGFAVYERNKEEGRWHFHALLGGVPEDQVTPGLHAAMTTLWWQVGGIAWVDPYDEDRGGEYYVLKSVESFDDVIPICTLAREKAKKSIQFRDPEQGLDRAKQATRTGNDVIPICHEMGLNLELWRGIYWTVWTPPLLS